VDVPVAISSVEQPTQRYKSTCDLDGLCKSLTELLLQTLATPETKSFIVRLSNRSTTTQTLQDEKMASIFHCRKIGKVAIR
jgi:hypothetical protein